MRPIRQPFIALTILSALLLAAGCRSKLRYERWQSIAPGASRATVLNTFGQPLASYTDVVSYADYKHRITAEFWFGSANEQLIYSEWSDPKRGILAKGKRPDKP
jgi:hypothetical protein